MTNISTFAPIANAATVESKFGFVSHFSGERTDIVMFTIEDEDARRVSMTMKTADQHALALIKDSYANGTVRQFLFSAGQTSPVAKFAGFA